MTEQEEQKSRARVLAFLGKGGAGKTVLTALTARLLLTRPHSRLLLVDADPAQGLSHALGLKPSRTLSQARQELIQQARREEADRDQLAASLDYLVMAALQEQPGFSLLVMGHNEGPGCFCPANHLLRESLTELTNNFDSVVIDAEAGMEQVSRQVTRRVDFPLIVSDTSRRGLLAGEAIARLQEENSRPVAGLILNRVSESGSTSIVDLLPPTLKYLGAIPEDPLIGRFDQQGRSLLELPLESPALIALANILQNARII